MKNTPGPLKKVLLDYSWKDLIGIHLNLKEHTALSAAAGIDYKGMKLTDDEYRAAEKRITAASNLFHEVPPNSAEAFKHFGTAVFAEKLNFQRREHFKAGITELLSAINALEGYLTQAAEQLSYDKISVLSGNKIKFAEEINQKIIFMLEEFLKINDEGHALTGKNFYHPAGISEKILQVFNKKQKTVHALRTRKTELDKLLRAAQKELLTTTGLAATLDVNGSPVEEHSARQERIRQYITSHTAQGAAAGALAKHAKEISNLEENYKDLTQTYHFAGERVALTDFGNLTEYLASVRAAQKDLETAQRQAAHLEPYHAWRKFTLELTDEPKLQEVITALVAGKNKNWAEEFKSWYTRGVIIKHEAAQNVGFNQSDKELRRLAELYEFLKENQVKNIDSVWGKKKAAALAGVPYNFNSLYNFRKNKEYGRKKNSLKKILAKDLSTFKTMFPIILTNPESVNALFPLQAGLFDVVMFDEASQLRLADVYTSLLRGKYKVITGDKHQMAPVMPFSKRGGKRR